MSEYDDMGDFALALLATNERLDRLEQALDIEGRTPADEELRRRLDEDANEGDT